MFSKTLLNLFLSPKHSSIHVLKLFENIEKCHKAFQNNELGRHIFYSPLKANVFKTDRESNLKFTGFFDLDISHFTSLIVKDKNVLNFKPHHDWFKA